jgi:hypothetical protein
VLTAQLKQLRLALVYNKMVPKEHWIVPRPGQPDRRRKKTMVPPYISNAPEICEWSVSENGRRAAPRRPTDKRARSLQLMQATRSDRGGCRWAAQRMPS